MTKIGIYNPYLDTKGGGEKVCLALASVLSKADNDVTFIVHDKVDLQDIGNYFGVDISKVKTTIVKPNFAAKLVGRLPILGGIKHYFYDLSTFRAIKKKNYDLFINNCFQSNLPNPSRKGVYMCMFPQKIKGKEEDPALKRLYWYMLRGLYKLTLHIGAKHAVYTYDLITANSKFTQTYIQKYWDAESTVLYPICENMYDPKAGPKEKIILHVGRFFEKTDNNHHKRQDFLLESFKKLPQLHEEGWELHFAGSVAEDVGGLKYILELIKGASSLPVSFHFNSSFDEMKHLYSKAEIYWHATGFGSDPNKLPEKQEHFGISTVEAMSTGAIPVVINSAGQKESVDRTNGYLWDTQDELIKFTKELASLDTKELETLQENAKKTARKYDEDAFASQVVTIFSTFL